MIERSVPILISAPARSPWSRPSASDDHVAPSLADLSESMLGQESANLLPEKVLSLPTRDLKTRHEHLGV